MGCYVGEGNPFSIASLVLHCTTFNEVSDGPRIKFLPPILSELFKKSFKGKLSTDTEHRLQFIAIRSIT